MSRSRTVTDFPRNEQGLVDHFLGTAYDVVKEVYLNLDELKKVYEAINNIDGIIDDRVNLKMEEYIPELEIKLQNNINELIQTKADIEESLNNLYNSYNKGLSDNFTNYLEELKSNYSAMISSINEINSEINASLLNFKVLYDESVKNINNKVDIFNVEYVDKINSLNNKYSEIVLNISTETDKFKLKSDEIMRELLEIQKNNNSLLTSTSGIFNSIQEGLDGTNLKDYFLVRNNKQFDMYYHNTVNGISTGDLIDTDVTNNLKYNTILSYFDDSYLKEGSKPLNYINSLSEFSTGNPIKLLEARTNLGIIKDSENINKYIDSKLSNDAKDDLFNFIDAEGKSVLRIDSNGNVFIPSFEGLSIQDTIKNDIDKTDLLNFVDPLNNSYLKINSESIMEIIGLDTNSIKMGSSSISTDNDKDIFTITDQFNNIILNIDEEGEVYIPSLNGNSIQESLKNIEIVDDTDFPNTVYRDSYNDYSSKTTKDKFFDSSIYNYQAMGGDNKVNLVYGIYRQPNLIVGTSWVGKMKTSEKHIEVMTPYNPRNRVVHPYLLEFTSSWKGYRYLLGLTGYYNTNEREENPYLLASNDLENWDLITGVLAERPDVVSGHNSDVFLAQNPKTGELIVGWRQSIRGMIDSTDGTTYTEDSIWYKTTTDGVNYSEARLMCGLFKRTEDILLSPSIIYDDISDTWNMYNVGAVRRPSGSLTYGIWHRQSKHLDNDWTIIDKQIVDSNVINPWHMEVKWVGDRLVSLVQDNTKDKKNLYFGVTEKGKLNGFIFNDSPVLADIQSGVYKASFVPNINNGKINFTIAWTGDNSKGGAEDKWKLFINNTNTVKI